MLKLYVLVFLSLFIIGQVCAEETIPSLFDEDQLSSDTPPTPSESSDKEAVKTDISSESSKEEGVLFNFLGIKIPDFIPKSIKKSPQPTEKNEVNENSLSILTPKAENGDLQAQLKLGYVYLYGTEGLDADYAKSFHFYKLAAMQNDITGLNNLGTLYYNGLGTSPNAQKAAELFTKAAELGNSEAATNLAFMYISGNGIEKDISQGIKYFQQAADENILAKFMIGYAYYKGIHLSQNYIKAAPLIKAAADAGLDEAQIVLSDIYIRGLGYPQNYSNAVKYLQAAVSQGNVDAMVKLADIYNGAIKYPGDIVSAHILYNLAFVRGITAAQAQIEHLQAKMTIEQIMQAQQEASKYRETPSQLTNYVHQTFGNDIHSLLK